MTKYDIYDKFNKIKNSTYIISRILNDTYCINNTNNINNTSASKIILC